MAFQDDDIAALTILLSAERLGTLTQLTGSSRGAIELHQESLDLGSSLMGITAVVEIALRNAISDNLSQYFATPHWLLQPPGPFSWKETEKKKIQLGLDSARRAEYSKLTQAQKHALDAAAFPQGLPANLSHVRRVQRRREQITVTNGKIIAELTLYFWKRLYSGDYEQSLWRTSLKKTFPNKKLRRADIADNLEHIYQARNRLAHHEPVLHKRFIDTMRSIQFVIENLGAKTASPESPLGRLLSDPIARVKEKADRLHARLGAYRVGPGDKVG